MSIFKITRQKGFAVTFENGFTVSVQFGPGNYCENQDYGAFSPEADSEAGARGSKNAETAVIDPDGNFIQLPGDHDTVQGWQTPAQVLETLIYAATQEGA